MNIDSAKFFVDLINGLRIELKADIKELNKKLDERLLPVEKFNWKLTSMCLGLIVLLEFSFKVKDLL